jgi:acetyl esterase/lipase
MKNLLIVFCFAIGFTACQKESKPVTNPGLPEQTLQNVSYGTDAAQKLEIYLPAGRTTESTKLIIMVHGGAWFEGDKNDFAPYVPILKQRLPGYAIANINYRLASPAGNFFPTQENDMKAAVDFLLQKTNDYAISQKIALLGASAGAHMALLQAYKYASPKIKAVISYFGPTDMPALYNSASVNTKAGLQLLLGGTPATSPTYQQSSPVNFVDAQDPPTIIFHGDADPIVNVSQSTLLRDKLQATGITNQLTVYPGLGHDVWPSAIMNETFTKIEAFLKANVN